MIELNGRNLTIDNFIKVARHHEAVTLAEEAVKKVNKSRKRVESIIEDKDTVYGINTGFGKLSDHLIECSDVDLLQENLLKSHACGIGDVFDTSVVRGMMLLRINALIKGFSGIRLKTIEKLMEYLNNDLVPVVYEQGSLGASGDLVPLAHMALPLINLGEVIYKGERLPTCEALKKANVIPLDALKAKEGLALINGTQAMTSVAALAIYDAEHLIDSAHKSAALTFEALRGIIDVFDEEIHSIRNQDGQVNSAKRMRDLLKGSKNVTHQGEVRVQDAYALRCIPQVHGPSLEAINYIKDKVVKEMNAVTDNPIILSDGRAVSAGNFHGQAIALVMDQLAIAVSELANISERRIERLVNPHLNDGLPGFLVEKKGLNSGFMIIQYAAASLVSENKILAHPASVDSIPSSANQEDHVSMGTIAARKALKIIEQTRNVIAIEYMSAAQAIGFRGEANLSEISKKHYRIIREKIPFIHEDEIMQPYIKACENLVKERVL